MGKKSSSQRLLKTNVRAFEAHLYLGNAYLMQGRSDAALAEFDAALKLAPNRALSLLGRMHAFQDIGDLTGAGRTRAQLAAIWHGADRDLPLLAEVRPAAAVPVAR